jgi:hypothetical protein
MKPLISTLSFCLSVCLFASCIKQTITIPPPPGGAIHPGTPSSPSSDQAISFLFNGDSTYVAGISVDTTRDAGFLYPQIVVTGTAIVPAKQDTLAFTLQLDNANNTYVSVNQFMGNFNDTSRADHTASLDLNSRVNYNDYENSWSGAEVLYVTISANDGKTVTATFNGKLLLFANNTGAPPTVPIANGTMKITLP